MPTTNTYYYSPSVNIIRDLDKNLEYIVTSNAKQVYSQIANNFQTGTHSFNIIGSYGTGKSSFLVALERHLNNKNEYFNPVNGSFREVIGFEFLPIIGSYSSLVSYFASLFDLQETDFKVKDILKKINATYSKIKETGKGWLIAIDEFGKFLEYAANHNPEKELYFIQQLAELINDDSKNILLVTALHQGFNDYASGLSKTQRNEWDKVKGRLKEITFNEPVEQLLLLASERISSKKSAVVSDTSVFDELFNTIAKSKTFPLNDYFNKTIAQKLLPFDILSAAVLTSALQRYGQNERSLFQFVDSNDHFGLTDFDCQSNPFYNISCVYDYLMYNYYSFLTTKHNPNYVQWASIRGSIERTEGELSDLAIQGVKLVKAIGLLNIFSNNAGIIDSEFLNYYAQYSLGIQNSEEIINKLSQYKIIGYTKYNKRFKLLEGTDLDIEQAIADADINDIADIIPYLNRYFDFPFIQAKEHFFKTGTPRFFQFQISNEPYREIVEEADGIINLIFSERQIENELVEQSSSFQEPILYCLFNNTIDIKNVIVELERINYVKKHHPNDKFVQREIESMLSHNLEKLNTLVLDSLFTVNNNARWIFNGRIIDIHSHRLLNQMLSQICDWAYPGTPIFKNEMVNKSKLSGAMQPARKNLLKALVANYDQPNLGFPADKFPPDKTIYLSLLKKTGIHSGDVLSKPEEDSFQSLWDESVRFLNEAKGAKLNINILVERLQKRPFRLKQGFIEFWLPLFLFINRDEYALFTENGYVPNIDDETLFLLSKRPKDFELKSFDITGIKLDLFNSYRSFLNIEESQEVTNESLIELIKPFLVFYIQQPEYNKKTRRISKNAIALRNSIALSKEPEKTFFEDFPNAIGISLEKIAKDPVLVKDYIESLQVLVKEIRTAYEELINRIESFILSEFIGENIPFSEYKIALQNRFQKLKKHMLLPKQKVLYQRLMSDLDIRNAWINSVCQAVIGKSLEGITDEEELILYDKFRDSISELDNLCALSKSDVNFENEEILNLEITSFIQGIQKHTLRFPKGKLAELRGIEEEIKHKLSKDRTANIALLLRLIQEQLND